MTFQLLFQLPKGAFRQGMHKVVTMPTFVLHCIYTHDVA